MRGLHTALCASAHFSLKWHWNWVRWTNAPRMTRHRQGVQPNWTDLSDWGCGVKQPAHALTLPRWTVTEESREVSAAQRKREWRLLFKADRFFDGGAEFEEGNRHGNREYVWNNKTGHWLYSSHTLTKVLQVWLKSEPLQHLVMTKTFKRLSCNLKYIYFLNVSLSVEKQPLTVVSTFLLINYMWDIRWGIQITLLWILCLGEDVLLLTPFGSSALI